MKNELIYDKRGIPSMMVTITLEEIVGKTPGVDCPAFIVNGKQINEISISKYPNVVIEGFAYSLPLQVPTTRLDFDAAVKACEDKGPGWHLMTNAEWAALARWCKANGTIPHGNTSFGSFHGDPSETGTKTKDGGKTLTGSGPATWSHDHTADGIYDLCGNVWEWVGGVRWVDGELQIIPDNDAAFGADQSADSNEWTPVEVNGKTIKYRAENDKVTLTAEKIDEPSYDGCAFAEMEQEIEVPELLKQLALYPDDDNEEEGYFWMDNTAERLAFRGGYWYYAADAGVFALNGNYARSRVGAHVGFRSAYIRPSAICQSGNPTTSETKEPKSEPEMPQAGNRDLKILARAMRSVANYYDIDPDAIANIAVSLGNAMMEVNSHE